MMQTQVCVVGGGPAGMMTGLLLARQGVKVTVLEKYPDFFRDFRGDTIHPSTLEVLHELGWLEDFLALPHAKMSHVDVKLGRHLCTFADFSHLPVAAPYIAFVPQWDFLTFLAGKAEAYPTFTLNRQHTVTGLTTDHGRVTGVRAQTPDSSYTLAADLVIGADGRHSTVRQQAGLTAVNTSPPMDVLWFRLPRRPEERIPFFQGGNGALVCIDRGDYWQIAYAVPAGSADGFKSRGLVDFSTHITRIEPTLSDRVGALTWDDIHLLSVRVDRLPVWHQPGVLCIGDAAHAMSPAGGVGINLAIQDAVATARILGPHLQQGADTTPCLDEVRARRELPVRLTQAFQTHLLKDLYPKDLRDDTAAHPPTIMRIFRALPPLRHLAGRFIGLGVRREHVSEE